MKIKHKILKPLSFILVLIVWNNWTFAADNPNSSQDKIDKFLRPFLESAFDTNKPIPENLNLPEKISRDEIKGVVNSCIENGQGGGLGNVGTSLLSNSNFKSAFGVTSPTASHSTVGGSGGDRVDPAKFCEAVARVGTPLKEQFEPKASQTPSNAKADTQNEEQKKAEELAKAEAEKNKKEREDRVTQALLDNIREENRQIEEDRQRDALRDLERARGFGGGQGSNGGSGSSGSGGSGSGGSGSGGNSGQGNLSREGLGNNHDNSLGDLSDALSELADNNDQQSVSDIFGDVFGDRDGRGSSEGDNSEDSFGGLDLSDLRGSDKKKTEEVDDAEAVDAEASPEEQVVAQNDIPTPKLTVKDVSGRSTPGTARRPPSFFPRNTSGGASSNISPALSGSSGSEGSDQNLSGVMKLSGQIIPPTPQKGLYSYARKVDFGTPGASFEEASVENADNKEFPKTKQGKTIVIGSLINKNVKPNIFTQMPVITLGGVRAEKVPENYIEVISSKQSQEKKDTYLPMADKKEQSICDLPTKNPVGVCQTIEEKGLKLSVWILS